MSQEYNVKQFEKGDFQDNHGNYWCSMVLEGVGEPVRIVVKDPMQFESGMTLYGDISEETSKAGRQYLRFRRAERPEGERSPTKDKPSEEYWEQKNATIRAQWAIGQAVQLHIAVTAKGNEEAQSIKETAKELFAMVDEVSGSQKNQERVAEEVTDRVPVEEYDKEIDLSDIPF